MRLRSIKLSWFRGGASEAHLSADSGSVVVYGPNGAGKSSFVDGVEVCVSNGKVAHLAHEYSGRHQEKGLINTHRPTGAKCCVTVELADGNSVVCEWGTAGAAKLTGLQSAPLNSWDYRRVALRQDEMATFIKSTKAEKYSALLPLLGLQHLEIAAENIRRLAKDTANLSKLDELERTVALAEQRRQALFGDEAGGKLIERLKQHLSYYLPEADSEGLKPSEVASAILAEIERQLSSLNAQNREAAALQELAGCELDQHLAQVRSLIGEIDKVAEPLIRERLEIIRAATTFQETLGPGETAITCPACGSSVALTQFRSHLAAEMERLQQSEQLFAQRREAVSLLCEELTRIRNNVQVAALSEWRAKAGESLAQAIQWIRDLRMDDLRRNCGLEELVAIEVNAGAVLLASKASASAAPPDVKQLIEHKEQVEAIKACLLAAGTQRRIDRIRALVGLLGRLEGEVRAEIKEQAEAVFGSISADIQKLWGVLYPGQAITDVRLHVPNEADKAIDVALKFYGVDQDSPRLTLSEGQRNALGLCIFLAMARRDEGSDRPILLDDVVVSLDREHRSQVARLLESEFSDRQVIILTHDREWFFELSRFLRKPHWSFKMLLPWEAPDIGIRFADHSSDFEKARANVSAAPEDAESNVRRIMDQALAEIAERLEVSMPYLRGDANDHRTAGQFLPRITSAAKKSLRLKQDDGTYAKDTVRTESLSAAEPEIVAWANRATHTFSASKPEAEAIIDSCEKALNVFECADCSRPVYWSKLTDGSGWQCSCGKLKWQK